MLDIEFRSFLFSLLTGRVKLKMLSQGESTNVNEWLVHEAVA